MKTQTQFADTHTSSHRLSQQDSNLRLPAAAPRLPCTLRGWLAGRLSAAGAFGGTNTHTPQRQTPPFPIKSTERFGMVTNPAHQIPEACPPRATVLPAQGVARGRTWSLPPPGAWHQSSGAGHTFFLWIQVSQLSIQRLDVEDPRAFVQTELNWRRTWGARLVSGDPTCCLLWAPGDGFMIQGQEGVRSVWC